MSGYLLVLGIFLAAQVNSANDRYGAGSQPQAGGINQPPPATGNQLVPLLPSTPADSRTSPAARPSSRSLRDPYSATSPPHSGSAVPPASPTSPPPRFAAPETQITPPATSDPSFGSTPQARAVAQVKPSVLMRGMLTPPPASRLTGEPITLAELVAGATSRAEQSQRIEAYWDLCSSVADYYLGLGEQDELRRHRSTVSRIGPVWEQEEKDLAVRIGTSERAARAAQHRLASWSGQLRSLPLPGDRPHCGDYHSHYDQIFAGRPSAEAQELSALLPLRYAELKHAAGAVTRAEEWLDSIAAVRNENSDGTGTLRALELWALRRRAFVQIARDYNRRIARYSELASPGQVPADLLIGMLIRRDDPSTATRGSGATPPPNRQSSNAADSTPSTFAGGWSPASNAAAIGTSRDEAIQPASAEADNQPRQERSLLVKPH